MQEKILESMRYCYDLESVGCDRCPIRDMCAEMDADSLGELFADIDKTTREESSDDI